MRCHWGHYSREIKIRAYFSFYASLTVLPSPPFAHHHMVPPRFVLFSPHMSDLKRTRCDALVLALARET